ncbi:hypothetical protein [Pedobacter sp. SYP-B3415]|uniref:DUF6965 family protein n=1 Tax=Pedobacter sp. SYP-B3415 TaxID=2496641 RepID=UPI00101CCB50|nr:hypothetical protein [Pedobacter sp. SYP-B3415]
MSQAELETYFETAALPAGPVRLNAATVIQDPAHFVKVHLFSLKFNPPPKIADPLLYRLEQLYNIIEQETAS